MNFLIFIIILISIFFACAYWKESIMAILVIWVLLTIIGLTIIFTGILAMMLTHWQTLLLLWIPILGIYLGEEL
jgi:hypothetical protein